LTENFTFVPDLKVGKEGGKRRGKGRERKQVIKREKGK
jgi:hypothetical protein